MAVSEQAEAMRWTSASETAARVRAGEWTPQQTLRAALERLEDAEPLLNAFQRVRRDAAEQEAATVAKRIAAGEFLPLAGVPIAAKDDVPIEGELTTAGSRIFSTAATETAEVVERMRRAGAIIIGVTRTPELCLVPFTESELGGITHNPWDLQRTPGGSSGGSAAAVAAGVVPIALGGDGGGSLRVPGAWCGLPGLYVTPGSVSNDPMGPGWTGMASLGGLARTVADTALLYDVLLAEPQQLTAAIGDAPPRLRIARSNDRAIDKPVPHGGSVDPAWIQAADDTAALLSQAGHTVAHDIKLNFGEAWTKFTVRYLASLRDELAASDHPERAERETRFGAKLGRFAKPFRGWALDTRKERKAIEASLEGFDVLITPTAPCSAPPVNERSGDRVPGLTSLRADRRVSFLNTWNLIGWPGINVPAGLDDQGLPLGTLITARPGQERLLLQLAAELEAARPWPLGHTVGAGRQPSAPATGTPATGEVTA